MAILKGLLQIDAFNPVDAYVSSLTPLFLQLGPADPSCHSPRAFVFQPCWEGVTGSPNPLTCTTPPATPPIPTSQPKLRPSLSSSRPLYHAGPRGGAAAGSYNPPTPLHQSLCRSLSHPAAPCGHSNQPLTPKPQTRYPPPVRCPPAGPRGGAAVGRHERPVQPGVLGHCI